MKAFLARLFGSKAESPRRLVLNNPPPSIYAIGDVHGCVELQRKLEKKILSNVKEGEKTLIIYLGDLVDRGLSSADVIDHCLSPLPQDVRRVCLRGNHDQAFLDFLKRPSLQSEWLDFGGKETMLSYGLDVEQMQQMKIKNKEFADYVARTVPREHVSFLERMPVALSTPHVHFVHAGIRPGLSMDEQEDDDLMWIRQEFLIEERASDKLVIHGHTPSEKPMLGAGRIGIDTGAYGGGPLTAIHLQNGQPSFLPFLHVH